MAFQTISRRQPSHRRAFCSHVLSYGRSHHMPTVSRLRTPATDQSCRVVAGASGVGEGEPDGSAGPEVTGSTKAQGGIRGAQLDGGRCFRTGCGRLVGPSRRVGRLVVQCTCIGLATKRFMLAILAAQADRGFLPRYRGRGGNRPWASRGGNRPRSAAETGPGILLCLRISHSKAVWLPTVAGRSSEPVSGVPDAI